MDDHDFHCSNNATGTISDGCLQVYSGSVI